MSSIKSHNFQHKPGMSTLISCLSGSPPAIKVRSACATPGARFAAVEEPSDGKGGSSLQQTSSGGSPSTIARGTSNLHDWDESFLK